MTIVAVVEYNIGRGPECFVVEDFEYGVSYLTELMEYTVDFQSVITTKGGLKLQHIDTPKGESIVYETEIMKRPTPEDNTLNETRKRKLRIRK